MNAKNDSNRVVIRLSAFEPSEPIGSRSIDKPPNDRELKLWAPDPQAGAGAAEWERLDIQGIDDIASRRRADQERACRPDGSGTFPFSSLALEVLADAIKKGFAEKT